MKYFFTAIWALVCIGVLAYSHIHWNQQTNVKADSSEPTTVVEDESNADKTEEVVEESDEYMDMAANWPEAAREQFKVALKEETPYKILFVGSSAMKWEKALSENLTENYGSERIITAKHTYDLTSTELLSENKQAEIAAEKAQLIVIEPFLLNDNGVVTIDVTLANITKLMEDVKVENPDTTFILQPSYPIYGPKYYAVQVDALKNYAEDNGIPYLDHWSAWPATDNTEINDYVVKEGPNEKGYQVWSQYLIEYFINK